MRRSSRSTQAVISTLAMSISALSISLSALCHSSMGFANIPAAYLACEGAPEGSECSLAGPQFGVCIRDTLCVDLEQTSVDECVLCVDGCWAGRDGESCIRPWTGEEGVCETQDRCTDRVETSFEECRRCVSLSSVERESTDKTMMGSLSGADDHSVDNHCDQSVKLSRERGVKLTSSSAWFFIYLMSLALWRVTYLNCRKRPLSFD